MEFILQKDEKIIKEIKPKKAMIGMQIIPVIFGLILVILFIIFSSISTKEAVTSKVIFIYVISLIILVAICIVTLFAYSKEYYWITNKRVAVKKGIIGYTITSIPYNKISDLTISRNLLEKIFGVGSIYIQTLAGQITGKNTKGAEGYLIALNKPEEVQEIIFKQMK